MKGIDVSEHNGLVDWGAVKNAGYEFALVRLGWGRSHLDNRFYENINGAISKNLKVGAYYYSYALDEADAADEAEFTASILEDCGLLPDLLEMGVWIDEEDSDEYRRRNGLFDSYDPRQTITNMAIIFINRMWDGNFTTGVYCNCDWYENYLDFDQLGGCGLWLAEPNAGSPSYPCHLWQYTFHAFIDGSEFDADELLKDL